MITFPVYELFGNNVMKMNKQTKVLRHDKRIWLKALISFPFYLWVYANVPSPKKFTRTLALYVILLESIENRIFVQTWSGTKILMLEPNMTMMLRQEIEI